MPHAKTYKEAYFSSNYAKSWCATNLELELQTKKSTNIVAIITLLLHKVYIGDFDTLNFYKILYSITPTMHILVNVIAGQKHYIAFSSK
jgi:hypothetical protein